MFKFFDQYKYNLRNTPQFLHVVDEHNTQKILSLKQLEKKLGFKWLEWPIDCVIKSVAFSGGLFLTSDIISEYLEIRYMDEKCGWGLFSRKTLPANTFIGLFTGEVYYQDLICSINSEHVFYMPITSIQKTLIVDASKQGNITRFIQHLPSSKYLLSRPNSSSFSLQEVAIENIASYIINLTENFSTIVFFTLHNIKANEIVGCEYDSKYWQRHNKEPYLFHKNGEIMGAYKHLICQI